MSLEDKINQFQLAFEKLKEAVDLYDLEKKKYILMR